MSLKIGILAAGLCVGLAGAVQAQPARDSRIDALFARWDKPDSGGCAVSVIQDGKVVHTRGYGMAELNYGHPITPATVFHVASLSKQFTAAAILKLANAGKISLEDPVRQYVPEVPDFGSPITLRHLLTHTSGLRDQFELLWVAGWRLFQDRITDNDALAVVARQKDLNFPPGSQYMYSNTNYTLLAQVVERVAKQPFVEFTQAEIFKPLGMTSTHFRNVHGEVVKNLATGYWTNDKGVVGQSNTNFDTVGATSLLTTVEDLARWNANLLEPAAGWPDIVAQMQEPAKLADGTPIEYGLGLRLGTYRGLRLIGHTGSDAGYRADFLRSPAQRFTAVTLCNDASTDPLVLNRRIADIYLAASLQPPPPPPAPLSPDQLARRAGLYLNPNGDRLLRVTVSPNKDKLRLGGFAGSGTDLLQLDETHFYSAAQDAGVEFLADGASPVTLIYRLYNEGPQIYRPIAEQRPSDAELAAYVGTYWSEETEYRLTIALAGNQLVVRTLKRPPMTLQPVAKDLFGYSFLRMRFTRDAEDRITGMLLSTERMRNLRYAKVEAPKP